MGVSGAIGTPYRHKKDHKLGKRKKMFNRHHARVRAVDERGAETLKIWHVLPKARCSPSRMATIVQAILALYHHAG